jgi:hypothetical protein
MSFIEAELSKLLSRPVELYHFYSNEKDYYYTSSDQKIIYNDITWIPETIRRSNIVNSNDLRRSEIDVSISQINQLKEYCFSEFIQESLQLDIYSYQIKEQEALKTFSGTMLQYSISSEVEIKLNFAQIGQFVLNKSQRYGYSNKCNHDQYSKACGLSLSINSDKVTILEINNNGLQIVFEDTGKPASHYQTGILRFTQFFKHNDIYIESDIIDGLNRVVTIEFAIKDLKVGDEVSASFGCQNSSTKCKSVVNFHNYFGFEYIPSDNYFTDGIVDVGKPRKRNNKIFNN